MRKFPIPQIDLSPVIRDGLRSRDSQAVLTQIRRACSEIGFMAVTGHGVPLDRITEIAAAAKRFFRLSAESKLAVAPPVRGGSFGRYLIDIINPYRTLL